MFALDAAMPFDYEHKATHALKKQRSLTIAIIGFGTFGQFLAKRLIAAGHQVDTKQNWHANFHCTACHQKRH